MMMIIINFHGNSARRPPNKGGGAPTLLSAVFRLNLSRTLREKQGVAAAVRTNAYYPDLGASEIFRFKNKRAPRPSPARRNLRRTCTP